MAVCVLDNGRFTSKDLLVQYLPCGVEDDHVQQLRFNSTLTGGTFKLRVNGKETAAITFSATPATLITNINTALDGVTASAGLLVASGAAVTNVTITADPGLGWFTIEVSFDALAGNTTADPNVTTDVTAQGSKLYTLSAQVSKFDYEVTVDMVDVTAISEYETTEIPVKEMMTFNLGLYRATEDWNHAVKAGNRGIVYVYEQGKLPGNKYFAFWAVFDKASVSFPDHDVVEAELSGSRQGAMVVPFDSIYA